MSLELTVVEGMDEVSPEAWNALVPENDPFTRHEFLRALETSGSVGPGTGWQSCHLLVQEEGRLLGAMPLYAKHHSYGEYIFDWAWAEAAHRGGLEYYPKLGCAVPFTPVAGRRLLTGTRPLDDEIVGAFMGGLGRMSEDLKASSFHVLFLTREEQQCLAGGTRLLPRTTHQYHWRNDGYGDFQDWLSRFRSRRRKEVRRERAKAAELGVSVRAVEGAHLEERHWDAMERFYLDTVDRKQAYAYLQPGFFQRLRDDLAHLVVAMIAESGEEVVASALCFQSGDALFGRYWGSLPTYRALHFELCYHLPIETCFTRGWNRFEAGAQGPHKIRRGLMPAPTWSVHWIAHAGLARGVAAAIEQENRLQELEMGYLSERGPFHR